MTTFAEHVDDDLRLRRALGFELTEHARLLPTFDVRLATTGAAYITVDLALGWAAEPIVPAGSLGSRSAARGPKRVLAAEPWGPEKRPRLRLAHTVAHHE